MFKLPVDGEISLMLLQPKHAETLFELVDTGRDYLREWLPWVDTTKSVKDGEEVIRLWLKQFAADDGFNAGIVYQGKIVGVIGFHGINRVHQSASIGYWLAEGVQGKGIMIRACRKMVEVAFGEYGLNRIEIRCAFENDKSRVIPERFGFQQEGIIRDAEFLNGSFHDHVIYGLTRRDYEKR